ncbi:MAG TPA: N-acetylmuramoyl-L-alanine amidase [Thermodesulfobacteriaceae bacterium]|nr:N-acetylmuramoyl-L-alanine amidase [Thermodesulfobacteriaceae bacterium]
MDKSCFPLSIRPGHGLFSISLAITILAVTVFLLSDLAYARQSSKINRAEASYRQAMASYKRLASNRKLRKDRKAWNQVINRFRHVYLKYFEDEKVAPKALYMMARCYRELYGYSTSRKDLNASIERYQVLAEKFPEHYLADDALLTLGDYYKSTGKIRLARESWERIIAEYPSGDQARSARSKLKTLHPDRKRKTASYSKSGGERGPSTYSPVVPPRISSSRPAHIRDVRHWSASDYTRVVIDASGPVSFKKGYLAANRTKKLPKRFYLDLKPAQKDKKLKKNIEINDGLLKNVRLAQYRPDTVRVVFDLGKTGKIKAFYLEDPFRIVVDAFGENYLLGTYCPPPPRKKKPAGSSRKKGAQKISLAQQLGLCVGRIVIDAGHGGKDPGAVGPSGLKEKDVVLKIAKKVATKLKKELNCQVILTRRKDRFLPLEQRTAIANAKKADLFISIHANASPNRRARGIETYFLNFAVDREAMRVAALENATSTKRMGDLRNILNNIMKNTKVNESSRLAGSIQKQLVGNLRKKYSRIKDLGVRQAPFFVLIGARMPSVLVEVSFISNKAEEKRLKNNSYLDRIAEGIVDGISTYVAETQYAFLDQKR